MNGKSGLRCRVALGVLMAFGLVGMTFGNALAAAM